MHRQLKLAATPPHKEPFQNVVSYYSAVFDKLGNVNVVLGKEAHPKDILEKKPDVVIVATGGSPLVPAIPGVDGNNVVTAFAVLAGKARVGGKVLVIGGGAVGCETANYLSTRKKKVTIIEMLDTAGTDMEWRTWQALREELAEGGVKIITGARIDTITAKGATATSNKGEKLSFAADTVVLALGVKPENRLAAKLEGKVKELYIIGDAKESGMIREAVSNGFITSYNL